MKDIEFSISGLQDGAHVAYSQKEESQLARTAADFIKRGIDGNRIVVLFVTGSEAEQYASELRQLGLDFTKLVSEKRIGIEQIDELLNERDVNAITEKVFRQLNSYTDLAISEGRAGLDIVGRIAANLAERERYEDALLVELFWEKIVPKHAVPLRLICPYGVIPKGLAQGLEQVHDTPLLIGEVWEITDASYKCPKCGKVVTKEIRIHEPGLMQTQSKVVSVAMKEAQAGWIPFCFDCISTHPIVKPAWLLHDPGLEKQQI